MKKECVWEFDGKNSLIPRLPSLNFNENYFTYNIIIWRGVSIEITINKSRGGMPVTTEYIFIVNEKTYRYSKTLTYGGGSGGGVVPEPILSDDFILTFVHNGPDFILREENNNDSIKIKGETINPFVIKTPEYPVKEKEEPNFKFKSVDSKVEGKSIFDDNPTIEINDESLTFDNGKLIYGAQDIYIEREGLELLYKSFKIEMNNKNILLEKLNEIYLNDFLGFIEFVELQNIPFQMRRL